MDESKYSYSRSKGDSRETFDLLRFFAQAGSESTSLREIVSAMEGSMIC